MQVASALDYLHRHPLGICNRDVKPENVLVVTFEPHADGVMRPVCKIADFGFSKANDTAQSNPFMSRLGTAFYVAPEIFLLKSYAPHSKKCTDVFHDSVEAVSSAHWRSMMAFHVIIAACFESCAHQGNRCERFDRAASCMNTCDHCRQLNTSDVDDLISLTMRIARHTSAQSSGCSSIVVPFCAIAWLPFGISCNNDMACTSSMNALVVGPLQCIKILNWAQLESVCDRASSLRSRELLVLLHCHRYCIGKDLLLR